MHYYKAVAIVIGVVVGLVASSSSSAVVPMFVCQPNAMSDAHPKVRQLCVALMERVEAPQENVLADDSERYERGTKRQDVDHVFLRFGRRMGL